MTLSLRELQLVFDGMRDGVVVVEPPRVVEVNPALCGLVQCRHKKIVDAGIHDLFHPADRQLLDELFAGAAEEPPDLVRLLCSDGSTLSCSLTAMRSGPTWFLTLRPLDAGDPDQATTDTRRSVVRSRTRELEESRNRYRLIVEGLADGLVTLNDRSEFLWINKTFAAMLGYRARSMLVARPILDCVIERDKDRVARGLARWERGDVARFEASLRHVDGTEVPVLLSGRAMPRTRPPGPTRLLVLVTDFAERQALSDRLVLARKMDALSSLAGGIAHDFNNLLTGILGNASRIRIGCDDPEVDGLARAVEDSAELAARLTQRLMALVREQAPHRKMLDLSELVEHTVGLVEKVLPESIELTTSYARELPPVLADESQLQQAVLNLCINARDAMMDSQGGGLLTITVRGGVLLKPMDDGTTADEQAVVLEVTDTGPGVPKELRDRIFDPFFTTKGLGRGIGLGLATVYNLLDAHGGTIDLDDARGGGARFTLRLPARPGGRAISRPERSPRTPSGVGHGTILLAEDEDAIRDLVAASLRSQGFVVFTAEDGNKAAELWTQHKDEIDLLFLDVRMPGLDGPDVLRLAREDRPGVPAVFSSGFIPDEEGGKDRFERVLYLPKPYRVHDLIATVRSGLDAGGVSGTSQAVTPVGGVHSLDQVSTAELPAYRPGQAIDMSATLMDEPPLTEDLD
jgi:two-component system, cell cycle sensor histidine kinase and response regulator CckA